MQNTINIPETMIAAVLTTLQKPLEIIQIELPKKLEKGQVLVKIFYSGICGSQLGEIDGVKGEDKYLPHLLGHEASGVVCAIGPEVTHVSTQDTVVLHWRKGLGIDAIPPTYSCNGMRINAGQITTFSEYAIVSENRVTKITSDANMKIAALFGCAITTGFGVIKNNAKLKSGETAVVFGAGGVGLNIIQAAARVNASVIIAVDRFDGRLAMAKKMGATHCVDTSKSDVWTRISDMLDGKILDCFIDNTGNTRVIEMGYKITGPQGRVILVGVPRFDQDITIHSLPLHFGKVITGSHGGEAVPHEDIPVYYDLYQHDKIKLDELITNIYDLSEINEAILAMRQGEIQGRCLIRMDRKLNDGQA